MVFSKPLSCLLLGAVFGRSTHAFDVSNNDNDPNRHSSTACSNNVWSVPRECTPNSTSGIFYVENNDNVIREFNPQLGSLVVADSARLAVQICNVENLSVREYTVALGTSLIPVVAWWWAAWALGAK
jgi:hypothetical protein